MKCLIHKDKDCSRCESLQKFFQGRMKQEDINFIALHYHLALDKK